MNKKRRYRSVSVEGLRPDAVLANLGPEPVSYVRSSARTLRSLDDPNGPAVKIACMGVRSPGAGRCLRGRRVALPAHEPVVLSAFVERFIVVTPVCETADGIRAE